MRKYQKKEDEQSGRMERGGKGRKKTAVLRRAAKSVRWSSGGEAANSAEQEFVMECIGEENAKELNNSCKEQISL